jgi:hypothetical protein
MCIGRSGEFGYFPDLHDRQFVRGAAHRRAYERDGDLDEQLRGGDLRSLRSWLD